MINDEIKVIPAIPEKMLGLTSDIEICEAACSIEECIDDFRWRAEPTAPQEYRMFKVMSKDGQKDFLESHKDFFLKGLVPLYLDQRESVKNKNDRNYNQLREWLRLNITQESRTKIEKILNTYTGRR
jgi:hypothetical protein